MNVRDMTDSESDGQSLIGGGWTTRYKRLVVLALACLVLCAAVLLAWVRPVPTTDASYLEPVSVPEPPHMVTIPEVAELREVPTTEPRPPLRVPDTDAIAAGMRALAEAKTPRLEARIQLPYEDYLAHVESLGGVLSVFEKQTNQLVGRIYNGRFLPLGEVSGFSPRGRDISAHLPPAVRKTMLENVRQHQGPGAYRFVLLLPVREETRFIGLLSEALRRQGLSFGEMDSLVFEYRDNGKDILIVMLEAGYSKKIHKLNQTPMIWH